MDSKNFYYSVEFFSRDIFLSTSGIFCCLILAVLSDLDLRSDAISLFGTITWIQLVILVGGFILFSVAWSFLAFRSFKMLIWKPIDLLFGRRLDYSSQYIRNGRKIDELYERSFCGSGEKITSYADADDLRLRLNVLLQLAQERSPFGYIYLQRLWAVHSMLGSMAFTSLVAAICAGILGKQDTVLALFAFAILLMISYAGMVRSNANEEFKVLGAVEVHKIGAT